MAILAPLAIGVGSALAGSLPFLLQGGPSEEEQERMMRRQLEIQDEFEQKRAARMGGGGDLAGLVGGGRRDLSSLLAEDELLKEVEEAAYALDQARSSRPRTSDELERILEGQTARIAALQSERVLSPVEIIQMMEAMGG